jgi:hypothetical protein
MAQQDGSKTQSWWQTFPGMLTAVAALITALTGLLVALHQAGLLDRRDTEEDAPSGESRPDPRSDPTSGQTAATQPGMGTLRTSAGNLVFDRITGMSLGNGKLAVSQLGARVDVPLERIKTINFEDQNAIRIEYRNGKSETAVFDCYWNLPVRFHEGGKEIYYGDCNDFRVVDQIEFHEERK